VKIKTTPGQPNPGTSLSKNKASYKTLVLTYPYAVVTRHSYLQDTLFIGLQKT